MCRKYSCVDRSMIIVICSDSYNRMLQNMSYSLILILEAVCSLRISVNFYKTTWRHIAGDNARKDEKYSDSSWVECCV
jgi:hypothetical protein